MTRLFKPFKLPSVTAYLIAGVLIGPYCLGALGVPGLGFDSMHAVEGLSLVSEVALGFIAFSIGNEFRLDDLKKTGKQALVVGILQALVAALLVDLCLYAVHLIAPDKLTLPQVLTLGAIATATAPAATLMVVRQYKAKGPLTKLLLPIVALDDAVGLVVFAV
ncbi:MAG: cation:proton antiporter, partial [Clostridia bacterium]|nr:cation:proton antiporter [Clostridia bacterium]